MEKISFILEKAWQVPAWKKALKAGKILERWPEIVGEGIARAARPLGFARGVLTLEVRDHIWLQRLRFEERKILALLNQEAGDPSLFERIRFVLKKGASRKASLRRGLPPLPERLKKRFEKELAILEDEELKKAFLKLRLTLARKNLARLR